MTIEGRQAVDYSAIREVGCLQGGLGVSVSLCGAMSFGGMMQSSSEQGALLQGVLIPSVLLWDILLAILAPAAKLAFRRNDY